MDFPEVLWKGELNLDRTAGVVGGSTVRKPKARRLIV